MPITQVAGKSSGAPATLTSLPISYTATGGGGVYTPVAGDYIILVLCGTKSSSSGNSTITTPTGFTVGSTGGIDNGTTINATGAILVRKADGTATDSPTITVTSATWQWYSVVLQGADTGRLPRDPTSPPQTPSTSTATTSNAGVSFTTSVVNEYKFTALVGRFPLTFGSPVWTNQTALLAPVGGTNNQLALAAQTDANAGATTPSVTFTGGSGTASVLMTVGVAPRTSIVFSDSRVRRNTLLRR